MATGDVVILGGSRGLGAALAHNATDDSERVWVVSRTRPDSLKPNHVWIQADLSKPLSATKKVTRQLQGRPVSLLVYNAGIWERSDLAATADEELMRIVNVNIASLILVAKALAPNLVSHSGALLVLISSTCGLENEGSSAVAYTATKFGVRGAAHALREVFRESMVRVTCVSPGSIASDLPFAAAEKVLRRHSKRRMPCSDIVALIRVLRTLSVACCVKEVHMPATLDEDV